MSDSQQTGWDKPPSHYDGEREVIDLIRDAMTDEQFEGFCLGNAIKYEQRAGLKGDPEGDHQKALWYRQMRVHVLVGRADPRSGRPGWVQRIHGYKRQPPKVTP